MTKKTSALKISNTALESKTQENHFEQVLSFAELKEHGFRFRPKVMDHGDGCFVIAQYPDDKGKHQVISIPCGKKSVEVDDDVSELSFGVAEDNTLIAFNSNAGEWI